MTKQNSNNQIKLIVVDLDGTLLQSDKTISEFTVQTLEKCRKQGIMTAIATARPVRAVDMYLDAIKPTIHIYHNGGITYHDDKITNLFQIDGNSAHEIIQKIKDSYPNIKIACEVEDTMYANFNASLLWRNIDYVPTDFDSPLSDKVDKVIVDFEGNHGFAQDIAGFIPNDVYTSIADGRIALIMNKQASKHNALATAIERIKLSAHNVVCFGDDAPDIGMIKYCGIGVAMENGRTAVKAAADTICLPNDDDGVAKWLIENILEKA